MCWFDLRVHPDASWTFILGNVVKLFESKYSSTLVDPCDAAKWRILTPNGSTTSLRGTPSSTNCCKTSNLSLETDSLSRSDRYVTFWLVHKTL